MPQAIRVCKIKSGGVVLGSRVQNDDSPFETPSHCTFPPKIRGAFVDLVILNLFKYLKFRMLIQYRHTLTDAVKH